MNDFNKFLPNACATMVRVNYEIHYCKKLERIDLPYLKANPGNALTQMTLQSFPASPSRASSSQSPPSPSSQPRSTAKPSLVRQQSRTKVERGGSIPKPESESKQAARGSKAQEKKLKGGKQKMRLEESVQDTDKHKGSAKRPFAKPMIKDSRAGRSETLDTQRKQAKPSVVDKAGERAKVPDVAPSLVSASTKSKKPLISRSDDHRNSEEGHARSAKGKRGSYRLPANVPGQRKRLKRLLPVKKVISLQLQ